MMPAVRRPFGNHAERAGPSLLHRPPVGLSIVHLVLRRVIPHKFEPPEVAISDQPPRCTGPLDEAVCLYLRDASACLITCSNEGFGRFSKARRAAKSFGWGGRSGLLI